MPRATGENSREAPFFTATGYPRSKCRRSLKSAASSKDFASKEDGKVPAFSLIWFQTAVYMQILLRRTSRKNNRDCLFRRRTPWKLESFFDWQPSNPVTSQQLSTRKCVVCHLIKITEMTLTVEP